MSDPFSRSMLKRKKLGFIGSGNLAQAIIGGIIDSGVVSAEQVYISNRSQGKPSKIKVKYPELNHLTLNEDLVEKCDIIFLAMKPQDLQTAIEPIAFSFDESKCVISLAAGVTMKNLVKLMPHCNDLFRVMANTASRVNTGVFGYCGKKDESPLESIVIELLAPLGLVVAAEEGEEFDALTVACASGTGFVLEMMTYWQTWLEDRGFEEDIASRMAIETFLGAAKLAKELDHHSITELREQVTSKKGVTLAGLEKMRELEIEGIIAMAFEKAVQRNKQLAIE